MKKLLFVVALLALLAPATFARDYMHMVLDANGVRTGATTFNSTATVVGPDQPDVNWEYDGNTSERKAESWNWPATYDWQDLCVIPVKMDVGIWIKLIDCKTRELKLKQVEIHKYTGSVTVGVVTNTAMEIGAYWTKTTTLSLGNYGNSVSVSPSTLTPSCSTQNVTITLTLSSVDLCALPGGTNCFVVGTVTVRVRPNFKPTLAGGCG
jgi:hypothetical protein